MSEFVAWHVGMEKRLVEPVLRCGWQLRPDASAAFARVGRVACLRYEVLFDAEKRIELVVVLGAKLEEVGARARGNLCMQVDHKVAQRGLQEHTHGVPVCGLAACQMSVCTEQPSLSVGDQIEDQKEGMPRFRSDQHVGPRQIQQLC